MVNVAEVLSCLSTHPPLASGRYHLNVYPVDVTIFPSVTCALTVQVPPFSVMVKRFLSDVAIMFTRLESVTPSAI